MWGGSISFLKHIERTKVLLRIAAMEDRDPFRDYKIIQEKNSEITLVY